MYPFKQPSRSMRRAGVAAVLVFFPALAGGAYDANGVALGASERDVRRAFPSAYCKPLEWESRAAERRCDDARVSFGGVEGRITFYLRKDAVQAFDLRFDTKDVKKLVEVLRKSYGAPAAETKDAFERRGKDGQEIYRARWEQGRDRAVLVAPMETRRAQLSVSRGNFEEEIYRVR
jgi:hypothetical protein